MNSGRKRIALAFPIGVPFQERIARGIAEYSRDMSWEMVFNPEAASVPIRALLNFRGDGVIAMANTDDDVTAIQNSGIPTVNISSALAEASLPSVTVDNEVAGKLAAQHLIARGYRHFGYYGVKDIAYGRQRGDGFASELSRAGFSCLFCWAESHLQSGEPSLLDHDQIQEWLRGLPRPVGVLAALDYRARAVVETCDRLHLHVPRDVGVIGVDDDVVACELCKPPLSSVALPGIEVGRAAAELLDDLMSGRVPSSTRVRIAPQSLVARASTDALGGGDARMAEIVQAVMDGVDQPINVAVLAQRLAMSRRQLERRFQDYLGCTPLAYLSQARVERAKQLLRSPQNLSLTEIARRCGFADARRLKIVFQKIEGDTPGTYRNLHRLSH